MPGHRHNPNASTQNQGNALGDRSSVRQSKLYRKYESGNDVKSLLGTSNLCWDPSQTQGAYNGQKAYDFDEHQNMLVGGGGGGQQRSHAPSGHNNNNDYGYAPKNYPTGGGGGGGGGSDYGYAPKGYSNGSSNEYSSGPSNHAKGRSSGGGGAGGAAPFAGDDATDYGTSNNSYGANNTTKNYGGGGGGAHNNNDYASDPRRRRDSFNDENQVRNKVKVSNNGHGEEGVFPMNKMSTNDHAYRNFREQTNSNASSFQSVRGNYDDGNSNNNNPAAVRTFHGGADASRSTRPW